MAPRRESLAFLQQKSVLNITNENRSLNAHEVWDML